MNLESVVEPAARGEWWGGWGRKGGVGEAHPSFPSSPGWRDSCGPPEEEEEEEEGEGCSICGSSTSESGGQVKKAREGWLLFRGSSTVHKHLCPRIQLRCLPKLPPPGRRAAAKGATDKSAAAGSEFNTFPVAAAEAATQICAEHSDRSPHHQPPSSQQLWNIIFVTRDNM